MSDGLAALGLRDLSIERPGSGFRVGVAALALPTGAAGALLGPSGCGKSTLLRGMLGLDPALRCSGQIEVLGRALPAPGTGAWRAVLRHNLAFLLQDARAALDPLRTLGAQLRAASGASLDDCERALRALGVEDAGDLLARPPHRVSGGQAQRALLAIALLRQARVVIADEPSAGLDGARLAELVDCLQRLRASGTAILVATHDHALVEALDARAWTLADGMFREGMAPLAPWPQPVREPDAEAALACANVGVRAGRRWLVRGASLRLRRGEVLALVGPSGAGKTTLARVLAGHRRPHEGSVQRPPETGVQLLFQDAYGSLTPHRTLRSLLGETAVQDFDIEAEARALGLDPARLSRRAGELSGGERRRAALLRALSVRPRVLILDEPTASLDRACAVPVVETLLSAGRRHSMSMLLITHDRELARSAAHRTVAMEGGTTCS